MEITKSSNGWSNESFLNKARRYASIMKEQDRDSWLFGFWSALTLEMIARATLTKISPVLIADGKEWNNIYFALGFKPGVSKFSEKSVGIAEVLQRIEKIYPEFTHEMFNFTLTHFNKRNREIHSGDLAFDGIGISSWLPMYYQVSKTLLDQMEEDFESVFGEEEKLIADDLIGSLKDQTAKSVQETINAHKTVWESKSPSAKDQLIEEAKIWSSRHFGHRVDCPACNSVALLYGNPIGPPTISVEDNNIIEKQKMLPSNLECVACGLKISGYSKLNACGLGDTFTSTSRYDPAEYFGIESYENPYSGDDDYND